MDARIVRGNAPTFDSRSRTGGRWLVRLFLLLGILGVLYGVRGIGRAVEQRGWPTTLATVSSNESRREVLAYNTSRYGGGTQSRTVRDITYSYLVGGRQYTGSYKSLRFHSDGARLAPGRQVVVSYSPETPHVSVLDPGVRLADIAALALGALVITATLATGRGRPGAPLAGG